MRFRQRQAYSLRPRLAHDAGQDALPDFGWDVGYRHTLALGLPLGDLLALGDLDAEQVDGAVVLALLMTLNITPGPTLFTDRPEVVWGLIASLLIANIVLLLMNVPMVKVFVKILMVPAWVLLPGVTMISFVGIYSLSGSYFDLLLMVAFGALGYILRKLDVPTVPVILGILLGGNMEDALRRAMVLSDGDFTFLFSTPISIGLWIAAILGFVAPMFLRNVLKKPQAITD